MPTMLDKLLMASKLPGPRIIAKAGIDWDTPFIQGLTLNSALQYYSSSYQDYAKKI